MMIGTPYNSPWEAPLIDPMLPSNYDALLTALSRYLPSSDEFRMYEFKVRGCTRLKAHDWTECPYAHPGEKARRRDPRRYAYSGTACTDFRKGGCRRGDACDFAHGVFECWLHPTRYRTQPCKDGSSCTRRVCFFAHAPSQLRIGSGSTDPFQDYSPPLTPVSHLAATLRKFRLRSMPLPLPTGFYSLPTTPTRIQLHEVEPAPDFEWVSDLLK